jgi:CDP-glucose 4,6-dehydratase
MQLAEKLWEKPVLSGAYNFGPETTENISVHHLVNLARIKYDVKSNMVNYLNSNNSIHETKILTLEIAKAKLILGVKPVWNVKESIDKTVEWYKNFNNGMQAYGLCEADIESYEKSIITF